MPKYRDYHLNMRILNGLYFKFSIRLFTESNTTADEFYLRNFYQMQNSV